MIFYKLGNPVKPTEYSLWASTYIIAERFSIPLIIQGENPALTLGVSSGGLSKGFDALEANKQNTLSVDWRQYLDIEGVQEKDLFLYHYNSNDLKEKGIRGIWLQYFLNEWSSYGNAEFSKRYGFKTRPDDFDPSSIGCYALYPQLDSDLTQVNQLLKYVKFGFGQCMDVACYDIRDGRISREKGIELIKKYDGKCSQYYIDNFCKYVDIDKNEFWKVANSFRGTMWSKDKNNEWKNEYWDVLESNKK